MKFHGSCSPIDLAFFKLSSTENKNKGPVVEFGFGKKSFNFKIDAMISL